MVTVIKKDNRARHRGGSRFECFLAGGKISIFDTRARRKGHHTAGGGGKSVRPQQNTGCDAAIYA